ncbi:MAG: beta-1,6-N-acetylglucosaminyltransferase [Mycobacteriales bacterium]
MTPLAFVVLAHNDPVQVRRLLHHLDAPVFLHCDGRTKDGVFTAMTHGLPERVTCVERRPTHLASWSLVDAELRALRLAVDTTDAQHIAVLSGADYPLAPTSSITDALIPWAGASLLSSSPLPWLRWSTALHRNGGLWRLEHRFVTRKDRVIFAGGVPLRAPWPRSIPGDNELRASSQWKILSREHVQLLLDVVDRRADLVRFWRTTLVPDETFIVSVLSSPALVGNAAVPMTAWHPWFIDWPIERTDHPRWLADAHFDAIAAASRLPMLLPDQIALGPSNNRKLFGRKFSSTTSAGLQDRIDVELLGLSAAVGSG